ncbi:MAG TPA: inorganic phosphate transporter [Thermoflexales bacterium]|nr:inorganic phosphate transporter [Thermoflexales bacterium]HQX09457.1 inorganic phosphate transporter [Thermoflexales bacterium]HQY26761.1 inorganic phosphate transporter [Thermoflexales bacterium]HQZ54157.1 inorganic phosphate transporter [Thermoflexales bacterium]HRA52198.1 inorganic phosphate transporter [Thermoflexales bacterium]
MTIIIILVILALAFDLLNGIHDSSNIVATMISSRAFSPQIALGITAICEFSGPFIFGVAVAKTIGSEIITADAISLEVLIAALSGAILWNVLTWFLGIPSSSSHAIVGGLLGAVLVGAGAQAVQLQGIGKVLIALFTSPIIGLVFGFVITKLVYVLIARASLGINTVFKRGQIVTAMALALSHGANDAQKSMGIITLALVIGGYLQSFEVPLWVVFACSFMIALGTSLGGWRLIRTLGGKFYKIRPIDGFSAQMASAIVILGNSLLGGPVSTTQVVSSAIMGVGAAERVNKVRWGVASEILIAWFLTIPATGLVSAGIYLLIKLLQSA